MFANYPVAIGPLSVDQLLKNIPLPFGDGVGIWMRGNKADWNGQTSPARPSSSS